MDTIWIIALFIGLTALHLTCAWLDQKHNWQLNAWFNGETESPFTQQPTDTINTKSQSLFSRREIKNNEKDDSARQLEERIQNLEKIVTTEAYELNQKINRL